MHTHCSPVVCFTLLVFFALVAACVRAHQAVADISLRRQAYTSREDELEVMASHFEMAENAVMLEEYRANVRWECLRRQRWYLVYIYCVCINI